MIRWAKTVRTEAALFTTLLLLLPAVGSCRNETSSRGISQIVARMGERSKSILTLSATIIGESPTGRTWESRIEFKRPALYRTETIPTGKSKPITITLLNETALWRVSPRTNEVVRGDASGLPMWSNNAVTFLAAYLTPSEFLAGSAQVELDDTESSEAVNSHVMRASEWLRESAPFEREPLKQFVCWVDRSDFMLRKIRTNEIGRLVSETVVKQWKEVKPGVFLPSAFESSVVHTIKYHLRDIRINEPISDSRFHPGLGDNILVTDAEPLSVEEYKKNIEADPDDPHLHYSLGKLYLNNRVNLADAEKAFEKTISLRPGAKAGYAQLGRLYGMLKRDSDYIALLEKAVALFPDDAGFHGLLSHKYERAGKYGRAIEELAKKLEIDPEPVTDENRMAVLLERTGDIDGASRLYRDILDSDLPEAGSIKLSVASRLVQMYKRAMRLEELEERYSKIVESETADAMSLKILADVYLAAGKPEESVATWERLAAQARAEDGRLLLSMAESFNSNEMFAETAEICEHVIRISENEYLVQEARRLLVSTRQPPEQEDELLSYYEEQLAANIGSNEWWKAAKWLMEYYEQQNELGRFIDKLAELVDKNPGNRHLYTGLVKAHKQEGDFLGAIEYLEKAIEANPTSLHFPYRLAETYEEAGLDDEAIAAYRQLMLREPGREYAYSRLVKLLYRIEKSDEALRIIELAKTNLQANSDWNRVIADMYASVKEREKAESLYLDAIELAPEGVVGHHGYSNWGQGSKLELRRSFADLYRDWGEIRKAEEQYRIVIANVTDDLLRRLAVKSVVEMYRNAGTLEDVLQGNETLLNTLKSRVEETRASSAAAPANRELVREFENAKKDFTDHSSFLASVYEQTEQTKKLVVVHETVAEALPEDSSAWTRLIDTYEKASLYDKATGACERLIELLPDKEKDVVYRLADLHERLHNRAKSIHFTERLLVLRPDNEATHSVAASLYSRNRKYDKAAEHVTIQSRGAQ